MPKGTMVRLRGWTSNEDHFDDLYEVPDLLIARIKGLIEQGKKQEARELLESRCQKIEAELTFSMDCF